MTTLNQHGTKAIVGSLTDDELSMLFDIAVEIPVSESRELTVLKDNNLIFFSSNAQKPGPHLSAEGHRVVAVMAKELLGCDTGGPEYDQLIREAGDCAEEVFGTKVIFERESLWRLRGAGSSKDFIGAAF
jgi:hypothetical protein